jgi:periplasmic protein CpxP/Spy
MRQGKDSGTRSHDDAVHVQPTWRVTMRTWIKRTLIGVFGASVLFGGLAACSHRSSHGHWGGGNVSEAEQLKWRERMLDKAGSRLDLDAAQKAKLAVLAETLAAQRKAVMAGTADPRAELQALVAGERFDRNRAQSFVDGKASAIRTASPAVIAATADFYDSLKPEQQQKVREMLNRGGRHGWRG